MYIITVAIYMSHWWLTFNSVCTGSCHWYGLSGSSATGGELSCWGRDTNHENALYTH